METTYESENYLDSFEHIANCPGADKTIQTSGEIEVEKDTRQLCVVPMVNGYWDIEKHRNFKIKWGSG